MTSQDCSLPNVRDRCVWYIYNRHSVLKEKKQNTKHTGINWLQCTVPMYVQRIEPANEIERKCHALFQIKMKATTKACTLHDFIHRTIFFDCYTYSIVSLVMVTKPIDNYIEHFAICSFILENPNIDIKIRLKYICFCYWHDYLELSSLIPIFIIWRCLLVAHGWIVDFSK